MSRLFKTVVSLSFALILITEGVPSIGHAAVPPQEADSIPADPLRFEPIFVEVAKRMTPTVVNISTSTQSEQETPLDPFSEDSFFKRFFGRTPSQPHKMGGQVGSGVIIDPNGYIVTNHNVIAEAKEIRVILNDRRAFSGKVVGSDEKSDLAVVKIDAWNLPSASWGDSSKLQVGEYALAIGNPFGLAERLPSALSRPSGGRTSALPIMKILSRPTRRSTREIPGGRW